MPIVCFNKNEFRSGLQARDLSRLLVRMWYNIVIDRSLRPKRIRTGKWPYIAMFAWLKRPKASSPMKVPAKIDKKYPTLKVMTANMLHQC